MKTGDWPDLADHCQWLACHEREIVLNDKRVA